MNNTLLFCFVFLSFNQLIKGQTFQNLDFEESCDSAKTKLCFWDVSWGRKDACKRDAFGENQHLLIEGKSENSVGFVEQSLSIPQVEDIQILKVSADIKSENVEGRGAGLNIGVYDDTGNLLATKDMGGFYSVSWIKGSRDWKQNSLTIICPEGSVKIKIGAILYGAGKARFDNYQVVFTDIENRKPSQLGKDYISEAIDIISKNSFVRDSINVEELKAIALKIVGDAQSPKECHSAVEYLLGCLRAYGDHHSFFMTAEEVDNWENNESPEDNIEFPKFRQIQDFGYVMVPAFHGGNESLMKAYADSLQVGLKALMAKGIKGWIVDLRENTGGNMEPMIMGLGPLFDTQKLGSLVDVNGASENWFYKNGTYYWDEEKGISVSEPVEFKSKLPIAVLTSSQTGSSGEIVVISFKGNLNTKSFGTPTWGLTTGNGSFDLSDKSRMQLASTIMADRNGHQYHGSINPDLEVSETSKEEDLVMKAAIEWLLNF